MAIRIDFGRTSTKARRCGAALLVLLAGLGLSACNDGDIAIPMGDGNQQPPIASCLQTTSSALSPDATRTCTWSIPQGVNGQVTDLSCANGSDCPARYVCSRNGDDEAGTWLAVSETCPNPSNSALPPPAGAANLYVSLNGTTNASQVIRFTSANGSNFVADDEYLFNSTENQGIAIDTAGNAIHVGDGVATVQDNMGNDLNVPGLVTVCEISTRGSATTQFAGNAFGNVVADATDRTVRGEFQATATPPALSNNPSLNAPKGVTIIDELGLYVVADFGAGLLRVFGAAAEGNVNAFIPVNTAANPWDSAYDNSNDILYVALTNGTIGVFEDFVQTIRLSGIPSLDGLINIVDANMTDVSVNMHGIDYDPFSDTLIVSDVGDPGANDDGQIFFLQGLSERSRSGDIPFTSRIGPTASSLGNPVDLELNGRDIIVAEKANDLVMVFRDVLQGVEVNTAPSTSFSVIKPESVAIEFLNLNRPSVSDLSNPGTQIVEVIAGSLQANAVRLNRFTSTLSATGTYTLSGDNNTNTFVGGPTSISVNGQAIAPFSDEFDQLNGPFGGLLEVSALNNRPAIETFTNRRDNFDVDTATGGNDQVVNPRGVEIVEELGIALLSDDSSGDVRGVSLCGDGTTVTSLDIDRTGALAGNDRDEDAWNADFDAPTGDLYVAMQNTNFSVFRDYASTIGTNPPVSVVVEPQVIDPVTRQVVTASTALRGIEYVDGADVVIVSDIGTGAATADGQILIMTGASTLAASELVDLIIAGPMSGLMAPVGIAFDGRNLYVADAGADMLYRFDNILSLRPAPGETAVDVAPSFSVALTDPTSIALVPAYVGAPAVTVP